tara:strand:- start:989 stop:1459 length:471 start_codon:yes stop_codon:yes gene_type:complete
MSCDKIKFNLLCINTDLKEVYLKNELKRNKSDAGFDLFMPEEIVVPAKARSFKLGTKVKASAYKNKILSSYEIWPRSSMGGKTPLRLCNSIGLVDREYTGELFLCVDNISDHDWIIKKNDRLVQLVGPCHEMIEMELVTELETTKRGENGLGSSGR